MSDPIVCIPASILGRAFFKGHLTVKGQHKVSLCDSCACRREVVRLMGEASRSKAVHESGCATGLGGYRGPKGPCNCQVGA